MNAGDAAKRGRSLRRAGSTLALLAALSTGCDGRAKAKGASALSAPSPKSGPAVAVLDLSEGLPEVEAAGLLGVPVHRASFDRFLRSVEAVKKDTDVKAVVVRFGSASLGIARAEEVGDLLAPLRKEGKPVYCHGDGFSNATLLAASRACTKIWVSPAGDVESIGMALQVVYFHKLLADELHLTIDFLQVGKFKGAEESFTRDGPSDEARASLEGTLADMRRVWLEGLREGRGHDEVGDAAEDGPYSPETAKARGLIDEVGYADDVVNAAKKESGAVREESRFGKGAAQRDDELAEVVRLLAGTRSAEAPIALIRASGSIGMAPGGSLLGGESGITEREMSRLLSRVEKDDAIKALVVRIDSPGGSALASDLIWHEMRKVRAKKPIVMSVGGMAASGGYYISSAANQIIAEPASILGSIGVVGGKIAFGDALEKIGVHSETFAAKKAPGAAARAASSSALTAWDDATRAKILETMTGIYSLFLARVAEGRGTTPDKIAPFAEGRLFSGAQAKEHGLVDELGGLHDAVAKARELAGLPADASVAAISTKGGLIDVLEGAGGDDDPESAEAPVNGLAAAAEARALQAPMRSATQVVGTIAPELAPYVTSLAGLASGETALTTLPFALVVR